MDEEDEGPPPLVYRPRPTRSRMKPFNASMIVPPPPTQIVSSNVVSGSTARKQKKNHKLKVRKGKTVEKNNNENDSEKEKNRKKQRKRIKRKKNIQSIGISESETQQTPHRPAPLIIPQTNRTLLDDSPGTHEILSSLSTNRIITPSFKQVSFSEYLEPSEDTDNNQIAKPPPIDKNESLVSSTNTPPPSSNRMNNLMTEIVPPIILNSSHTLLPPQFPPVPPPSIFIREKEEEELREKERKKREKQKRIDQKREDEHFVRYHLIEEKKEIKVSVQMINGKNKKGKERKQAEKNRIKRATTSSYVPQECSKAFDIEGNYEEMKKKVDDAIAEFGKDMDLRSKVNALQDRVLVSSYNESLFDDEENVEDGDDHDQDYEFVDESNALDIEYEMAFMRRKTISCDDDFVDIEKRIQKKKSFITSCRKKAKRQYVVGRMDLKNGKVVLKEKKEQPEKKQRQEQEKEGNLPI